MVTFLNFEASLSCTAPLSRPQSSVAQDTLAGILSSLDPIFASVPNTDSFEGPIVAVLLIESLWRDCNRWQQATTFQHVSRLVEHLVVSLIEE